MIIALYILMGLSILGAIVSIATIGDERKPRSKAEAIANGITTIIVVWLYLIIIKELNN